MKKEDNYQWILNNIRKFTRAERKTKPSIRTKNLTHGTYDRPLTSAEIKNFFGTKTGSLLFNGHNRRSRRFIYKKN